MPQNVVWRVAILLLCASFDAANAADESCAAHSLTNVVVSFAARQGLVFCQHCADVATEGSHGDGSLDWMC